MALFLDVFDTDILSKNSSDEIELWLDYIHMKPGYELALLDPFVKCKHYCLSETPLYRIVLTAWNPNQCVEFKTYPTSMCYIKVLVGFIYQDQARPWISLIRKISEPSVDAIDDVTRTYALWTTCEPAITLQIYFAPFHKIIKPISEIVVYIDFDVKYVENELIVTCELKTSFEDTLIDLPVICDEDIYDMDMWFE